MGSIHDVKMCPSVKHYPHCFSELIKIMSNILERPLGRCLFRAISSSEITALENKLNLVPRLIPNFSNYFSIFSNMYFY